MPSKEDYQKYKAYYLSAAEKARKLERKRQYKEEGKCPCGRPLIDGGSSAIHCAVCVEGGVNRRRLSRWK